MKLKLTALAAAALLLVGCHTNSSGWPIIWGLHNGTPVVESPKPAELLKVLKDRDTTTLDLVEVGHRLVKKYGTFWAERLVLDTWAELTSQPIEKSSDVIWLVDQSPRVRDVAWMLQYRSEWLKP